jgi:hypothetical protein
MQDYGSGMIAQLKCMLKPDDRSIENALIGVDGSLAEQLNKQLPISKRVATVNMDIDKEHGTISEYVESGLKEAATYMLRKVGAFYSTEACAVETIALAFLGGIWDLHHENVIVRGGKPVAVDADVAMRPNEFKKQPSTQQGVPSTQQGGPSTQVGLDKSGTLTDKVRGQLKGDKSGTSKLLQYAIDNPEEVIQIIREVIGEKKARIIPVFTAELTTNLQIYVLYRQEGKRQEAKQILVTLAQAVADGVRGSSGLRGELGDDRGGLWQLDVTRRGIKSDFQRAQLPFFTYQPSTGFVFYHKKPIWKGDTIDKSMEYLKEALLEGRETI